MAQRQSSGLQNHWFWVQILVPLPNQIVVHNLYYDFLLYNQKIRDGLTSLCYNAGNLKHDKYSFITKGLAKCRYDYKNQKINSGDYNVSFSYFKNIKDNPNRRNEEYKLFFMNANKSMS